MAGLGPGPFCAMLLADLGAQVLRVCRPDQDGHITQLDTLQRGKASLPLDLKKRGAASALLKLAENADVLIEGYRPGVMERLGIGPEPCLARNPKLIYGRMTGWGQDGPLSQMAGHDLNYIAISGALAAIGSPEAPVPPLNLVGDFGGGALYLAVGILAALRFAALTGRGQVVDAAMCEGAAHLMTPFYGLYAEGNWRLSRASNFADGGAHFYGVYQTADSLWVSIGAIERPFYTTLVEGLGLTDQLPVGEQWNEARWPSDRILVAEAIGRRTMRELHTLFDGKDACLMPVLDLAAAPAHRHMRARHSFVKVDGVLQPAPAPRFSATPNPLPKSAKEMPSGLALAASWGLVLDDLV
ncbi:Succinyl-CoA--L-malate CoA-transferase beta subunit [Cupriavidus numazuensis]|uniref:Succinyl-CoA--L-malate CoA-transferase beta subunit n=2 Tax=Cupriavidus numazuensis TaxID=221992 RepID=A0ABN7QAR2_9BURK|nr:Succinyl-CoA--L-malate CoA-transferase beta subunit [Cupriavidus numazuensis]